MTTYITAAQVKAQLNIVDDNTDNAFIVSLLSAAQAHVENLIGHKLADYVDDPEDSSTIPKPLIRAVILVAAWHYEQRELATIGTTANPIPFGVAELIAPYRAWTFG